MNPKIYFNEVHCKVVHNNGKLDSTSMTYRNSVCVLCHFSSVWLFARLCQAPLSMGFSKQEYWSGLPMPSSRGSSQPREQTHVFTSTCIGRPEKAMAPTPVLLPGKSHGGSSLVGCSPWGCYESDTTEQLHFHFSLPCIGEGNGNPLQCSCLENLGDGGAWWAAVYGVSQSRTRLKWLSSSSSIGRQFFTTSATWEAHRNSAWP